MCLPSLTRSTQSGTFSFPDLNSTKRQIWTHHYINKFYTILLNGNEDTSSTVGGQFNTAKRGILLYNVKYSLLQECRQGTDKLLLVYVFHCNTWHLKKKRKDTALSLIYLNSDRLQLATQFMERISFVQRIPVVQIMWALKNITWTPCSFLYEIKQLTLQEHYVENIRKNL